MLTLYMYVFLDLHIFIVINLIVKNTALSYIDLLHTYISYWSYIKSY